MHDWSQRAASGALLALPGARLLPVPQRLSRWVASFWVAEWAPDQQVHVLPDGTIDIVCALRAGEAAWFVSGPLRGFARHQNADALRLVGASLQPGAASLLGLDARELSAHWQALSELGLAEAKRLFESSAEASFGADCAQVVHALGAFIESRAAHGCSEPRVWEAVATLHAGAGNMQIAALARDLRVSERTLLRLFERHLGLSPKSYARIVRFQHGLARVRNTRVASLAELAVSCGYSDQAHLTRDFVELGGVTPSALLPRARR